jgi:ubiquinone biosynthesis protein COQ9
LFKKLFSGAEVRRDPAVSHGMFPNGGAELVHFFYEDCNQQLADILVEKVKGIEEK